jgi:hypothetical protein
MTSSLGSSRPTLMETSSSLNFRDIVCDWSFSIAFFTYCWVMVEPPCVSPPLAMLKSARPIPTGSMPLSVSNFLFSADMTAYRISLGICSYLMFWRLVSPPVDTIGLLLAQ